MSDIPPSEIRPVTPAATVIPLRDGLDGIEVLMVHRNAKRGMFAGFWVFPGGQVDPADRELHVQSGTAHDTDPEIGAARHAAVREAEEEAGVRLDASELVLLSHWMPPPRDEKRFSTWFFLAPAHDAVVAIDGTEIHDHDWITPAAALARFRAGEIQLAPPTAVTLTQVGEHARTADVLAHYAAASGVPAFHTRMKGRADNGIVLAWQGDAAYDTDDADTPGPRNRCVFDPAGTFDWTRSP